jgi:hypothetical protein
MLFNCALLVAKAAILSGEKRGVERIRALISDFLPKGERRETLMNRGLQRFGTVERRSRTDPCQGTPAEALGV